MGLEVVGVEGLGRVLRDLSRLRLGEVARRAAREWGVVAVGRVRSPSYGGIKVSGPFFFSFAVLAMML